MDQRDFELLLTLKETENITRAAEKLYITQSSLSKRVQAIEKELDVKILLRSRKGVNFTPQGEIVLSHIEDANDALVQMKRELIYSKDYISGTLNLGASINYTFFKIPELLEKYRKKYPHVSVNLSSAQSRDLNIKLSQGKMDIAIIRGDYQWSGEKILLSRERVCAIKSENDKEKNLTDLPFIGRESDSQFERELVNWFYENSISPKNHGIRVDNIVTCVDMVERGLGWSIVPEICLDNFKGIIKPLYFKNGEPFVRSTYLMYNKDSYKLPQVKAFVDLLMESKEETYVDL